MATYYARKAGNINAADVWSTTPSGTASNLFPTFTNADVLMANSFAITVNVSTTVAEVRNDTTGGATAGGFFDLNAGVTLTGNVFAGSSGTQCVRFSNIGSADIVGNCTAGTGFQNHAVFNNNLGTLNITGNVTGGNSGCVGALNSPATGTQAGIINITGNVTGGTGGINGGITASGCRLGQNTSITGTINITGNVTGGTGVSAFGVDNAFVGTINIFGTAIGGTTGAGANNSSTGQINITRARGNAYGPGNTSGLSSVVGASNTGLGVIEVQQVEYGIFGQSPVSGTGIRLKKANTNVAVFNFCDTAGAKTLIDATQNAAMPAASNVRSGVSYASGALTGSCAVPAASSVAFGVPVDNTTGTAVLTPAAIRAELATELARIDTTISSRLSPSGTLATVTTLTNAPTVPTAAEIATAVEGSLLNEADGQAVLNAIVSAIGNTNLSEVSLVAAIRSDLERTGGKIDSIPTAAAPSAASVASAVWSASTKEITGGVVDTLTNSPDVPTEAEIASQVRTELSVELARIDAAISSRLAPSGTLATVTTLTNSPSVPSAAAIADEVRVELATELARLDAPVSGATAPSAATVASQVRTELTAELAKVSALNTERLANVATTAIVGNLIAQANS